MCLINFQLGDHNDYKLIMAANRDEAYQRPTKSAHFWEDHPEILAGRDLRGMGTWLGITKGGRIAALTNVRNADELLTSHQSTRGELVSGYLKGEAPPEEYLNDLRPKSGNYAGFNLLAGNQNEMFYINNYDKEVIGLNQGVYGLSNHHLNTPWPKVEKGRAGLGRITAQDDVDIEHLFKLLRDDAAAPMDELPETGVSKEIETHLSPLFINMGDYGTRCSTVILIDKNDDVTFVERTYLRGEMIGEEKFNFGII